MGQRVKLVQKKLKHKYNLMKKLYDKSLYGLAIIWIIPLFRYFVIAIIISIIIGLFRGTSPLLNIF